MSKTKEPTDTAALVATWAAEERATAERTRKALAEWWPLARAVAYGQNPDPASVRAMLADSGRTAAEFDAAVRKLAARRPLVEEVQSLPRLDADERAATNELGTLVAARDQRIQEVYAEFYNRIVAVETRRNDLQARILQARVFGPDSLRNGNPNDELHTRLSKLRSREEALRIELVRHDASRKTGVAPNQDRDRDRDSLHGQLHRVLDEIRDVEAEMVSY